MNTISQIIIYIMVLSMAIAAIDRMIGNKLGLADSFENGFNALGGLVLGMGGIMVSANLIGKVITATIGKLFTMIGADACMAGSLILAIDTGGYALAHSLQPIYADIANFSSIFIGSMLGPTISFTIPVALGIINKEDEEYLAVGSLAGIVCIPFACLIGGIIAGYELKMMVINIIPFALFSVLIAIGLYFFTKTTLKVFVVFSKIIIAYSSLFIGLAIIQELTPMHIVDLMPLSDVWLTCGSIAIMLAGAFPLVKIITKLFNKQLEKIGSLIGVNDKSIAGLIACLANCLPAFGLLKDMDNKGKIINCAFAVCAAFALGDHLGFCAGVEPGLIAPMVIGKILGGIMSIFVGIAIYTKKYKQN